MSAALAFIGLALITGTPQKTFVCVHNLQYKKVMGIFTALCVILSVGATNRAIKLLPVFCAAAIALSAPAGLIEAQQQGQKRVIAVQQPDV